MATTQWNPADKAASTVLSNGNLTAMATTSSSGGRAVDGYTTGKYYVEYTNSWSSGSDSVGIATSTAGFNAVPIGQCSVLYSGSINLDGSNTGSTVGGGVAPSGTIGMAVDISNKLIWFRGAPSGNWNGSGTANPATGTGGISISTLTGTLFPWFSIAFNGDTITANFGATAFSGAVPGGFTSGWPGAVTASPFVIHPFP